MPVRVYLAPSQTPFIYARLLSGAATPPRPAELVVARGGMEHRDTGAGADADAFYDALEGGEADVFPHQQRHHPALSPPPLPPRPAIAIEADSPARQSPSPPSPPSSPASSDLSVHHPKDADEEADAIHLSRYRASVGNTHPLAGLEEQGVEQQSGGLLPAGYVFLSDSVSEAAGSESLASSSFDGLSAAALSIGEGGGGSSSGGREAAAMAAQKIKVRCKKKIKGEFSHLWLIQELGSSPAAPEGISRRDSAGSAKSARRPASPLGGGSSAALYAVAFSPDGNYLAAAGDEGVVRIWKLLVEDIMGLMITESGGGGGSSSSPPESSPSLPPRYVPPRQAAIFQREPCQVLHGHEEAILDLCWSKNNFLLSASMDKSVRLWHFSRSECLGVFHHPDFVTSVAFNPRDDRLFITGSLDCRLRLWSIAERSVKAWNELPALNYITAVAFSNTGRRIYAGTSTGVCLIFDTEGLIYTSQIHVHSRTGKNRIGKKITGIDTMPGLSGNEKILISSNDSRVRLYTLQDKTVVSKYIGLLNQTSQIRASFSDDGEYIIAGSEDHRVFIWNAENRYRQARSLFSRTPSHHVKSCEYFQAHSKAVTAVVFAPSAVRNRLQSVGLRPVLGGGGESAEGQIIAAVDLNGRVRIYENNSLLEDWLAPAAPQQ